MEFTDLIFAFLGGAFVLGGGLLYLVLALVGVFVVGGWFIIWKFRTRPLIAAPAVVILVIGILQVSINMNPIRQLPNFDFAGENALRKQAELECESQLPKLAEVYEVDGIADTVTALSGHSIVRLLVNRQLAFIEIKVQSSPSGNQPYILRSTSFPDNGWTVDQAPDSYVKIELADKSADACLATSSLHKSITELLAVEPLPFNNCIKTSYSQLPTARHLLTYQAAPHGRLGYYQLIDTKDNSVLAQLATSDVPQQPRMEMSVSTLNPSFQRPGCRTPHTALMDRLFRTGYKTKYAKER